MDRDAVKEVVAEMRSYGDRMIQRWADVLETAAAYGGRGEVAGFMLRDPYTGLFAGRVYTAFEDAESVRKLTAIHGKDTYVAAIYTTPPPAPSAGVDGLDMHPATRDLVARFSEALLQKLAAAEKKYGYSDGWARPDWMDECRQHLAEHVAKGDPRDVAAYCAFLWHHGESTAPNGIGRHVRELASQYDKLPDWIKVGDEDMKPEQKSEIGVSREAIFSVAREIVRRIAACGASPGLTHAESLACDFMHAFADPPLSGAWDRVCNAMNLSAQAASPPATPAGVDGWKLVETAPKSKHGEMPEYVLVSNATNGYVFVGYRHEPNYPDDPEWCDEHGEFICPQPTHWMRRPAPPSTEGQRS